jgi:hypothetical protein
MGIYQKQASAYFHAKSGLSEIAGNVVFNGKHISLEAGLLFSFLADMKLSGYVQRPPRDV